MPTPKKPTPSAIPAAAQADPGSPGSTSPQGSETTMGLGEAAIEVGSLESRLDSVVSPYGAPMGRAGGASRVPEGPVTVFRANLDSGGYDDGGAYWGLPNDLFCATDGDQFREFLRATSKEDAQAQIRERCPGVEFRREFDAKTFVTAYLECAIFADHPEESDGEFEVHDFAPEAVAKAEQECLEFIQGNLVLLAGLDESQCGHDFWLTRNGHGAGFWDRGLGERGRALTKACKSYGSVSLVVNDDGQLWIE